MRTAQRILPLTLSCVVACLIAHNSSNAKKPDNPRGGGDGSKLPPRYDVIELGDYFSTPSGISPAPSDDELVWVAGFGVENGYTAGLYSVVSCGDWQVLTDYLPEPRTPLNGGPGSEIYGETFNRASNAYSVNATGDIVGGCDFYNPEAVSREYSEHRAALWLNTFSGHVLVDLGLEDPAHNFSSASDVNDLGSVVGTSALVDFGNEGFESAYRAFVWEPLIGMVDLNDLLPADSGWILEWAAAINNVGQICGRGRLNGEIRGFVFDLNTLSVEAVPLLPGGGSQNGAVDINDNGHVTGWAEGQSFQRAYVWTGGVPFDLGSLTDKASSGLAINISGEVVGWSNSRDEGSYSYETLWFATYWNVEAGEIIALEDEVPDKPKWEYLEQAGDINDQGWIVSHGRKSYRGSVTWHGIILVPAD